MFGSGAIDFRMMAAIVSRCENVTDPQVLAPLDAAVATHAPKWMKLSGPKLSERIDMWVEYVDSARPRDSLSTCCFAARSDI